MNTQEDFRPKPNLPPTGFYRKVTFAVRLVLDLQVASVYRHVKLFLGEVTGKLLDVGCGESPYRFLINDRQTEYFGLDIAGADRFDYRRTDIVFFDGKKIPFDDDFFDAVLCTEVLEHVYGFQVLADEVYRTLSPGGKALFTVPWSARYHYLPFDFFRYTPATFQKVFKNFKEVKIIPRGTDVTSISSKLVVLFFRNLLPHNPRRFVFFPMWLLLSPFVLLTLLAGRISLCARVGSDSDPIGYSLLMKK